MAANKEDDGKKKSKAEVKSELDVQVGHFRPEFINRIDDIIVFDSLDQAQIRNIVIFLKKLLRFWRQMLRLTLKKIDQLSKEISFERYGDAG